MYENRDWKGYTVNAVMITSRDGRRKGKDVMERGIHCFFKVMKISDHMTF